jgi:hypothetical protein
MSFGKELTAEGRKGMLIWSAEFFADKMRLARKHVTKGVNNTVEYNVKAHHRSYVITTSRNLLVRYVAYLKAKNLTGFCGFTEFLEANTENALSFVAVCWYSYVPIQPDSCLEGSTIDSRSR